MAESSFVITIWPTDCPFSEVGCTSSLSNSKEYTQHLAQNTEQHLQLVMDLHRESEVISPLQKLNAIRSEVEYLEGTLENLGVRELPALECIKTQMRQPGVSLNSLGDKCAFRMPGFIKLRESSEKWSSPVFSLRDKYQLRLKVYPTGIGAGKGTHLSVSLTQPFGDNFEWPILLPRHLGVKVELLVETDGSVSDDSTDSENLEGNRFKGADEPCTHMFTWRPKLGKSHSQQNMQDNVKTLDNVKQVDDSERQRRVSLILPPWCQPPPSNPVTETPRKISPHMSGIPEVIPETEPVTSPKQRKHRKSTSEEMKSDNEGAILFSAEKFVTHRQVEGLIREFNSLVFQVSVCLVQMPKSVAQ